ncbi:hypothetical protein D3C80_1612960 [compost metagenome]
MYTAQCNGCLDHFANTLSTANIGHDGHSHAACRTYLSNNRVGRARITALFAREGASIIVDHYGGTTCSKIQCYRSAQATARS